jgi:polysaccharide biosynthesis transport protein
VVLALLRDSVDQTFHRSDQIENATGLPVLTMVPTLKGSTPPSVHVLRKPVSPYSEALRKLQIGIELSEASQSPRTILFCSATPAEGKSVMASSLGRLLASNGKRVMLIDCDWRRPTLHRVFRCSNKSGLVALLTDERVPLNEIIYNDPLSGLDVIPSGEWSPRSVHALTSQRMRLILQSFAKNYDFVLLDTPPVFVGAEVLTLSRMVDKAVFVVRWGHTRRDAAIDALKQLVEAQADVAGVALSRVDPRRYRQYAYGNLNYQYSRSALGHFG